MQETPSSSSTEETKCNRRLSRAAREILRQDILPILRHYADPTTSQSYSATDASSYLATSSFLSPPLSVKSLPSHPIELSTLLTSLLGENTKNCELHPQRDVHLNQELHSHRTHRVGGRYKSNLYQCGICRKNFQSKYYLDLHLETTHDYDTHDKICPADVLCPALGGMQRCERVAFEMEPYYSPGSGGLSSDARHIKLESSSKLQRLMMESPCHERDMITSRALCTSLFTKCFASHPELQQDLLHVCDTYTCAHTIHSYAGLVTYNIHHFRDVWRDYSDHGIGYVGV
eukprot:15341034-Ditylum_brightwellii.AAC.1